MSGSISVSVAEATIINGPSEWELVLAFFNIVVDGKARRIFFKLAEIEGVYFTVGGIEHVSENVLRLKGVSYVASVLVPTEIIYDTKTRNGSIVINAVIHDDAQRALLVYLQRVCVDVI